MSEFVPDRRTPFYWRCMEIDGLGERVGLKDLLTLWWASLSFLRVLATFDVDQPAYQRAREMIGPKPTQLKYLRGVLRFWIEQE